MSVPGHLDRGFGGLERVLPVDDEDVLEASSR